jgi:RNA polymerase sigma factor (sigma-70 family)
VAPGASELTAGVRDVSAREELLVQLRPVAFTIAYRMLGSVSEAEDVVQEALLRVHQALEAGEQIASPRAFVATVTTRLAIDELRSARVRREEYVGEWLPEPIITDGRGDPPRHAEMADSLSLALLVLLESLSPEQRAVLLLHDVFGYDHAQIAQIIGKSQDNVRQLAARARRHVGAAPAPLPNHARAARGAGTTVLSGHRARRSVGAGGAARPRRGADRRRRREGARLGAHAARPRPCRAR